MKSLYRRNAVLFSLIWLGLYLVLNTITDNIAGAVGYSIEAVSAIPNLALAAICFYCLKRLGISEEIGLFTAPTEKYSVMLFYIPILILPFLNLIYGFNTSLSASTILLYLAMYIGVGFMEEIIFRGLMFRALTKKWNRYITVAFISLTFAFGHIVSVVAVGMSGNDVLLQIVNAFIVGFMFMLVIIASGNLTICVLTHILYNFIANISLVGYTHTEIIAINTAFTLFYLIYLIIKSDNLKAYFNGK